MTLKLRWKAVAALITTTMMLSMVGVPQVLAQDGAKVAQVVIQGNKNVNSEAIQNVVKLAPGSSYAKDAIEKDRAAINGLGFFSAVSVRTEDTAEGVRVIYDVVENPIVKDIEILGSAPVPAEKIKSILTLKPGQVLNTVTLGNDVDAIQRYYDDQQYVASVTEDIGIDRETGVLTIPIIVHTVGKITIVGNKKTKNVVFLREMKTKSGQIYNKKVLVDDINRIFNLDILDAWPNLDVQPGAKIGTLDVSIAVAEKKTGSVSVGLGYSSQSQLVGRAEMTETNFQGRGRGLTLLWETAAASKGSGNKTGGTSSYDVGFVEPWIDKHHTSLSLNVFNKLLYRFSSSIPGGSSKVDGQTYNERRKGASVGLSRPINDFTRVFLNFRGETVDTADIPSTAVDSVTTNKVTMNGPISSITSRILTNTKDFERDPAEGWYKSASFELGKANVTEKFYEKDPDDPEIVNSTESKIEGAFTKLQFDLRRYLSKGGKKLTPNDKRNTLAVRFMGGVSAGSVPFFEQYFAGGADTIRGYREDRFWGSKMFVASAEYRRPIAQSLAGVLFADYGSAWGTKSNFNIPDMPQSNSFKGHLGVGVGLRVNTPIGNLRLDYGIGDDGARTHFSMGQAF